METLTLSEAGLALILLEHEINNNRAEVNRTLFRLDEAKTNHILAEARLRRNEELLKRAKQVILTI